MATLPEERAKAFTLLLIEFQELFAWKLNDMSGIREDLITHELNIDPSFKPITQKRRPVREENATTIRQEVGKKVDPQFATEISFKTRFVNPVLVKKINGKWRMCVNFRDLNKTCPKVAYPLHIIYPFVDATSGHEFLSFMDAYFG